jgi:hypothetical protein
MMAIITAAANKRLFSSIMFFSSLFFFCLLNPYHLCVNLYVRSSGSRTKLAFNSSFFFLLYLPLKTKKNNRFSFSLFLLEHAQLTLFLSFL